MGATQTGLRGPYIRAVERDHTPDNAAEPLPFPAGGGGGGRCLASGGRRGPPSDAIPRKGHVDVR